MPGLEVKTDNKKLKNVKIITKEKQKTNTHKNAKVNPYNIGIVEDPYIRKKASRYKTGIANGNTYNGEKIGEYEVGVANGTYLSEKTDTYKTKIADADTYINEEIETNIGIKTKKSTLEKTGAQYYTYLFVKRAFDIICSLLGIIALIPVAIVTKICYIATGDKKSIFYKQKRIGKNGKPIYIYKLRSMVWNADEVLKELLKDPKYKKEWDLNQKFENDPRITKMGNILRKTSLDELPQFINVIKGDMSMIGPRPLVEGELDAHKGNHAIYESVRPGISGWWAANGRSATTYERRLELEYFYCKNCNLILDIKCVFLTIAAVLFKTGAK